MTRRTIALVIEALSVGGAEQMLVVLANELAARGHTVHMVCLAAAGELADQLHDTVTVHVLDKQAGIDIRLAQRLRRLLLGLNVDVINSHLWVANLWTRISLLGSRNPPLVVTEHSRDTWKPGHYRLIDRCLAHRMQYLVAVSQDTAEFYRDDIGIAASKLIVINNGVDTARYAAGQGAELRQQWLLEGEGELLIGTVGRLVAAKNHARLLDMCARLLAQGLRFRLLIVGDGPERATIEALIDKLQLADTVIMTGSRQDIPDILAALDIFVLSSDREGHPLTALEAQAAGTPVVLTNAGGSADALAHESTDSSGILVEKSAEALAAAVARLATDEPARVRMGQFAKEHALRQFDRIHMVDAYFRVFEQAMGIDSDS